MNGSDILLRVRARSAAIHARGGVLHFNTTLTRVIIECAGMKVMHASTLLELRTCFDSVFQWQPEQC